MNSEESKVHRTLMALLTSIQKADIPSYESLVSAELTCFEPETQGHRVDGRAFHVFLTEQQSIPQSHHLELVDPVIRVYGDTAYAAYTLLVSRVDDGVFKVSSMNETRIFRQVSDTWQMVHFHRSRPNMSNVELQ